MFSEPRPLDEELAEFDRILVEAAHVMIVANIISMPQTIITHYAHFQRIDSSHMEHYNPPCDDSV
jgi:hypothetical protein